MRVFVAGAGGAIGRRLVPLLVSAGHQVTGMTRAAEKAEAIRSVGAGTAIADALDPAAVLNAVRQAAPEVLIHELTALPAALDMRRAEQQFAATNVLRTRGLDNLIAAARAVGARRLIAQSFTSWPYARTGGPVKNEDDPLDPNPPRALRNSMEAIRYLESTVSGLRDMEGVVLRYGAFYGPGNTIGEGGALVKQIRKRQVPIVGNGAGIWSFIHIDDAARATAIVAERGAPGIYNIVDDEPAPVSGWLPALASAVGAKPPFRIPAWLARLLVGEQGVVMMTEIRGASNAKAKRELGWQPTWTTWREGFRKALA